MAAENDRRNHGDMNTHMPAIITASNVVKHYNQTYALAGVGLDIGLGESLAIMGPSGSGKTTLLHCLAGIIRPDEGSIRLLPTDRSAAADITGLKESGRTALRREVFGFVFQQGLLLPELTAEDNVALAAMLAGMPRTEATKHARAWLQRLGLGEHLTKRIGQLSGGQAQRVAIARSQVTQPVVTFADEPTGALDSRTSSEVLSELLASTTGRGSTLVVVTHDENVAARCSRVVRLADGRIVSDSAAQYATNNG
ncbi:putative ABC transport system ATP-binding protein [Brevibacterium casei CIP 102111]|nr:putative ABC transport system ATP-binding protein [Brevibacterium casei CIP 102111]